MSLVGLDGDGAVGVPEAKGAVAAAAEAVVPVGIEAHSKHRALVAP